ncbi:hypothetical protein EYC80_001324 [Monilinia laxa]|uniref:DUF202 domain-containing protein n=1 Tax=Monilinia laxa TaxID=61186 RepID=A0A5N6K941_MONLA|nr:hypothetical protein EYC80_001324 [Monilinia laxa]
MDRDASLSTRERERGGDNSQIPQSQTSRISQNKVKVPADQRGNDNVDEILQKDLNRIPADSTDISQLRSNTPNTSSTSNANIEAGLGLNIYAERQRHNSSPGGRTDNASGSRSGGAKGSLRIQEGKRQRIDSILEEARNRKVAMNTNTGRGEGGEGVDVDVGSGRRGGGEESLSPRTRGNGFDNGKWNGNRNGNEYVIGRESRAESSADEETSVLRRGSDINYGGVGVGTTTSITANANSGHNSTKRKSGTNTNDKRGVWGTRRGRGYGAGDETAGNNDRAANGCENGGDEHDGKSSGKIGNWWKKMTEEYGSIELENKGSVARDHLALERTFLAWLRTSLAFASIGIAITQLFRLNTSSTSSTPAHSDATIHLRHLGKPLGATFVGISILMLSRKVQKGFEGYVIVHNGFDAWVAWDCVGFVRIAYNEDGDEDTVEEPYTLCRVFIIDIGLQLELELQFELSLFMRSFGVLLVGNASTVHEMQMRNWVDGPVIDQRTEAQGEDDIPIIRTSRQHMQPTREAAPDHSPDTITPVQPSSIVQQPPSTPSYRNLRRVQRDLRESRERERENCSGDLHHDRDHYRENRTKNPIMPLDNALLISQAENTTLQKENRELKCALKEAKDTVAGQKDEMLRDKEEGEMLGREIVLEYARERAKWMNAMWDLKWLISEKDTLEAWRQWGKGMRRMLEEEQGKWAEILAEGQKRESKEGVKDRKYRVRVKRGENGMPYTVFEYGDPRNDPLDMDEIFDASKHWMRVEVAEEKYGGMVRKREMDREIEEKRKLEEERNPGEAKRLREAKKQEEARKLEEVPDSGEAEIEITGTGAIAHLISLVHRPATHNVPASGDLFPQSSQATKIAHSIPLVLRPAVTEIPVQQPFTIEVPLHTRNLCRRLRQVHRKFRETLKERRIERKRKLSRERSRERWRESDRKRERARRDESTTSDDFYNRYMEVDPVLIRRQIQYLHMDLYRSCGSLEGLTEMKPRDQGRMQILLEETLIKKLASELVVQRMRRMKDVENIKELIGEEHTVEAWKEWAKKMADKMDKDQEDWEECRKKRNLDERMHDGRERPPEYRTYSDFIWNHEIDRAVEEAEREAEKEAEKNAKREAEDDELDSVRHAMRGMSKELIKEEAGGVVEKVEDY